MVAVRVRANTNRMEKEFPVVDASEINEASLAVRRIISSMLSAAVAASPSES